MGGTLGTLLGPVVEQVSFENYRVTAAWRWRTRKGCNVHSVGHLFRFAALFCRTPRGNDRENKRRGRCRCRKLVLDGGKELLPVNRSFFIIISSPSAWLGE